MNTYNIGVYRWIRGQANSSLVILKKELCSFKDLKRMKTLTNKHISNISLCETSRNHSTVHTSEEQSFWLQEIRINFKYFLLHNVNYTSPHHYYHNHHHLFFLGMFNGTVSTARLRCVEWNYRCNGKNWGTGRGIFVDTAIVFGMIEETFENLVRISNAK
jgi:hypothetical protein